MVTLDDLLTDDPAERTRRSAGDAGRQLLRLLAAGLYGLGWLLAKTLLFILAVIGGVLYGVGWLTRRALWPALVWMGAAVRLGWEEGRSPDGGSDR